MSEFSPPDIQTKSISDCFPESFLSEDEGNGGYYVQRSVVNMIYDADGDISSEQIENAINSRREESQLQERRNKTTTIVRRRYAEQTQPKSLTSNLCMSSKVLSPTTIIESDFGPYQTTDYTYARTCSYRRSSPSDKNAKTPILRRKSLHLLHRGAQFFFNDINVGDAIHENERQYISTDFSDIVVRRSLLSRISSWFKHFRLTDRQKSYYTNINGVPLQMKNLQASQRFRSWFNANNFVREVKSLFAAFFIFYLSCVKWFYVHVQNTMLRTKEWVFSGKSSAKGASSFASSSSVAVTKVVEEDSSEIATKEIRKVVTEEIIVDDVSVVKEGRTSPTVVNAAVQVVDELSAKPKRSVLYWPCIFCVLLPFLLLLPFAFLAFSSQQDNSTLLYNCTQYFKESVLRFVYFVPYTVAPITSPEQILPDFNEESVLKIGQRLLELQKRVEALETANSGNVADLVGFRQNLKDLTLDANLVQGLLDKVKIQSDSLDGFCSELRKLESSLHDGANERDAWRLKLVELMDAHDKRNAEFLELRRRIESLAEADCNCSSLLTKTGDSFAGMSLSDVDALITAAIEKYDADKTGLPDYALEPAGGAVLSTRCTVSYASQTRQISWFGIPTGYEDYSPRIVIQPTLVPGECWAFAGSVGYLVIKLSRPLKVTAVSYEHIPKLIAIDGKISSAPLKMAVYGLQQEFDPNPVLLGEFEYDDEKAPLQYFPVQNANAPVVPIVEFKVLSNHGHLQYTCLYRFRVHGKISND